MRLPMLYVSLRSRMVGGHRLSEAGIGLSSAVNLRQSLEIRDSNSNQVAGV